MSEQNYYGQESDDQDRGGKLEEVIWMRDIEFPVSSMHVAYVDHNVKGERMFELTFNVNTRQKDRRKEYSIILNEIELQNLEKCIQYTRRMSP